MNSSFPANEKEDALFKTLSFVARSKYTIIPDYLATPATIANGHSSVWQGLVEAWGRPAWRDFHAQEGFAQVMRESPHPELRQLAADLDAEAALSAIEAVQRAHAASGGLGGAP